MDFEYQDSFYFSESDEKEVLDLIENGMTVEQAVEDWRCGLYDCDYFEASKVIDQIESYIRTKL